MPTWKEQEEERKGRKVKEMTDEKDLSRAKKALDLLKGDCDLAYKFYDEARDHMLGCRDTWNDYRLQYETADRKLAMLDGRYKVVKVTKEKKKIDVTLTLTPSQVQEIANRLGVKIEVPE